MGKGKALCRSSFLYSLLVVFLWTLHRMVFGLSQNGVEAFKDLSVSPVVASDPSLDRK